MKTLTACLLLLASSAFAESHEELIDRAFEALEDDLSARWSYTQTQESGEGLYVGRYDPGLPESERWSLVSVDGRTPTDDETEEYLEDRAAEEEENSDEDDTFESIAKKESIALVEETDQHWIFSFEPAADSEDDLKFMESVHGTLKVIKDGHYVSELTLQNTGTIKPGKGIKIEKFLTRFRFAPVEDSESILPHSIQATVKGKAFFVVKIDETETIEYSDFKRVSD